MFCDDCFLQSKFLSPEYTIWFFIYVMAQCKIKRSNKSLVSFFSTALQIKATINQETNIVIRNERCTYKKVGVDLGRFVGVFSRTPKLKQLMS